MILDRSDTAVRCCQFSFKYLKMLAATALVVFLISDSIQATSVTTNTFYYSPGETVVIAGFGFQANESVGIQVTRTGSAFEDSWHVNADASGGFGTYWIVPFGNNFGETFIITASGQSSDLQATTSFMGANTNLEITLDIVQPVCRDTLTSLDSIVFCAKLSQGCFGTEVPLPDREILLFFNHGDCGINGGQDAFQIGVTDSNGIACIVLHGVDTLLVPSENASFRAKFLGEDRPGPNDPPNSACHPDDRVHLSASNDCKLLETTENCQSGLTFDQQQIDAADIFSMKTADLNRDNFTDIVYCGTNLSPGLFVTLAVDENEFDTPTQCLDIHSAALAIDFVNADSLPDIVATTVDSTYVLLNGGQGSTCESWTIIAQALPSQTIKTRGQANNIIVPTLLTGYFNADNSLDFFVGPGSVFFGDGAGNISGSSTIPVFANSVVGGDFNSDGSKDLLIVDIDSAYIFLNDGIGIFSESASLFVDTGFISIPVDNAVADLDGDCHTDFLITIPNVDSSGVSVLYLGFGDGLGHIDQTSTIFINGIVQDVIVTDVDRDHILDIIASNGTSQRVEIYRGKGDRTFGPLEFFSTALAGDSPFSLASADFDRNGQPDFLSASTDNGNLLLSSNNLEDLPVMTEELVVTAFTNTTMQIINPYGFQTSDKIQTIAGGNIWTLDVNGDDSLDEQVIDNNLVNGVYELTYYLLPEFDNGSYQPLSSSVRIDGSQQATIFDNYSYPTSTKTHDNSPQGCYPDSLKFTYLVGEDSSLYYPFNGIQTNSSQPTFFWGGLLPAKAPIYQYHLQVDRTLDFTNPMINDSNLTSDSFRPCTTLFKIDSVYYWHVRWYDGVKWSGFSNTFAVYIGSGCCIGNRGDANSDGANANIADLAFIVDFIFRGGICAECPEEADVNGDDNFNVSDLTYLVEYVFRSGPAPGKCF